MKIEVKNLNKKFKKNDVLKNINLLFESGNIYGLYGRNGSGKTVFQKIICGFYIPSEGEVLYDGINLNKLNKFPINLRALIETPSFFPDLTGYQNLEILAKIQNKISDEEIIKALDIVNLLDEKDKKFSKYSLGMKQKLGIAQAIMEDPDILVLDEPFNGVDRVSVNKIANYLLELKNQGKIIIISTHIKEDIDKLANITYEFNCGEIVEVKNVKK